MKDNIMVSICCAAYNHEKYIRQALDSFLMQKTNFKYEIIVQDDASTDNTAKIIREYQKKYPNIIKPIYNKENQYNKSRVFSKMFEISKGKYVAGVEGDDYWIDPYKIQKQFDYMESNQNCSLLVTNYKVYNDITGKYKKSHLKDKDYTIEDILLGDGNMFATSSMFANNKHSKNVESFYHLSPFEDYVTTLHIALHGNVHLLRDYTTVYRINAINSATSMIKTGDESRKRKYLYNEMKNMLEEFNKNTNNKYKKYTEYLLLKKEFIICVLDDNTKMMRHKKFKHLYKMGSIKNKFLYFNKIHFSRSYIFLRNIKHKVEKY